MIRPLTVLAILLAPAAAGATPPIMPDEPPPVPPGEMRTPPYRQVVPSGPIPGDPLGDVWEMEEVASWTGTWIRRGRTGRFDGYWRHPTGERVLAPLDITREGRRVIVIRRHTQGRYCRYDGAFSVDWRAVSGRYTCTWARTPMPWRARVLHLEEVTPELLRDRPRRR